MSLRRIGWRLSALALLLGSVGLSSTVSATPAIPTTQSTSGIMSYFVETYYYSDASYTQLVGSSWVSYCYGGGSGSWGQVTDYAITNYEQC